MKQIFTLLTFLLLNIIGNGQTSVVPIVTDNILLGGVQNGKWLTAKQTIPLMKNEVDLFLISPKGLQKNIIHGKKGNDADDFCVDTRIIEVIPDISSIAIGANIHWNPFPRTPKTIPVFNKTYQKIVSDLLKTKRIAKPKIKITQIFQIDLDGDGTEEVLMTGTNYRRGIYEVQAGGDYSFALLRKIINGKSRTILIDGEFFTKRGDYPPPLTWEIDLIADLNGDGKMEVWLDVYYYEGNSSHLYEITPNKLNKILEVECGV